MKRSPREDDLQEKPEEAGDEAGKKLYVNDDQVDALSGVFATRGGYTRAGPRDQDATGRWIARNTHRPRV
jgi:hypothetical protein